MSDQFIILYPKKLKFYILIFISLFFMLFGLIMINENNLAGYFITVLFGFCILIFVLTLLPQSTYIRLTFQGFETRTIFRSHFCHWSEVSNFKVKYVGSQKLVVFDLINNMNKSAFMKYSNLLTGAEAALPDTYGKSAEDLVKLLNEWKIKYD